MPNVLFESNEERMLHAQASLIPLPIFSSFFRKKITQELLDLMVLIPTKQLSTIPDDLISSSDWVEKLKYWIAIAYSHPEIEKTSGELMAIANALQLEPEQIIVTAALFGNKEFLTQALERHAHEQTFAQSMSRIQPMDDDESVTDDDSEDDEDDPDKFLSVAIYCAAIQGDLVSLKQLISFNPGKVHQLIAYDNYDAFTNAADYDRLDVMNFFIELMPDNKNDMVSAGDYAAFRLAALHGRIDILKYLLDISPDQVLDMVRASDYGGFSSAAQNGHLDMMNRIMALAPNEIPKMINTLSELNCHKFENILSSEHHTVINQLLQFPVLFAYTELHDEENGEAYVYPFVALKLNELHAQQTAALSASSPYPFDLENPQEIELCFFILRNLIRRNNNQYLDEIQFLLSIPAVRAIAHQEVTPNQANELLKLALTLENKEIVRLLLTVPAIRELAEKHEFYHDEIQNGLDLNIVAHDLESAMTALTPMEQHHLDKAQQHYDSLLAARGIAEIIDSLRAELTSLYLAHPAVILVNEQRITLPIDWEGFNALQLTGATRQEALKAYYQNKYHTALRYLSRPNHWIDPSASFTEKDTTTGEKWASFEPYLPLISLLWVAVKDQTMAPDDDNTFEGRVENFITELSLIGRTHNYDKTRLNAKGVEEESDDLEGDKPSCYSGTKRRLFQSIIGHPLFTFNSLTANILENELAGFLRDIFSHAIHKITTENKKQLRLYWDEYIYYLTLSAEGKTAYQTFNITPEQQQLLIAYLKNKYPGQLDLSTSMYIDNLFSLKPGSEDPNECLHAFKFDGIAHFQQLLPPSVVTDGKSAPASPSSPHDLGFFSSSTSPSHAYDPHEQRPMRGA